MFGVGFENVQSSQQTFNRLIRGNLRRALHSRSVLNEEFSEQGRKTRMVQRIAFEDRQIVHVADNGGVVICSMMLRKNSPGEGAEFVGGSFRGYNAMDFGNFRGTFQRLGHQ